MMKRFITGLLILIVGIGGVFATNPDAVSFQVQTEVAGINLMRITTAKFSGTSKTDFENTTTNPTYAGPLNVTKYGNQDFTAYISTLSNSRVGYKVTMGATAMADNGALIQYTVTANEKSVDTSNAENGPGSDAKVIIDTFTNGMTGVASQSHKLSLFVDQTSFNAAVEGTYTGTVTFTWTTE